VSPVVAFVGLGRMGGPMADHVIRAGFTTRVFDLDPGAVSARVDAGGSAAADTADAARGADVLCCVVFDETQAAAVLDDALPVLAAGAVITLHTTVSVDGARALAERAAASGATLLDAGISGGETGARAGTLLSLVGGPDAAVDRVRPVLATFSKEVVHAGPLGAGMALKLARNLVGYAAMAAVHEAAELAHRAGVGTDVLRHVLVETSALEQGLSTLVFGGPEPLPADDTSPLRGVLAHTLQLAEKDLDQALALAEAQGAPTPVTAETRRSFHRAVRL
jgi:3-hydroxyisobutyrate dehydrogenase